MESKSFKSGIRGIKYENSSDIIKDIPIGIELELKYNELKEFPNSVSINYEGKRLGFIARNMSVVIIERQNKGSKYKCYMDKKETFVDDGITYNGGFVRIVELKDDN